VSRTIRESIPVEHRAAVAALEEALGEMTVVDVVEWHTLSLPALEHLFRNQSWPDAA
jgi:hypothetical protein